MIMEEHDAKGISRSEARDYILDLLQDLAQLARASGDGHAEDSLSKCWQAIWRTDPT